MKEILIKYRLPIIVLSVLVIFVIVAAVMGLSKKGSSETKNEYFTQSIYPVSTTSQKDGKLLVTIDGSVTANLDWTIENSAEDKVKIKKRDEKDGVLSVEVSPVASGYATVTFLRKGKIKDTDYTAAKVTAELLTEESDQEVLSVVMSDIYQSNAYVGAADTKTPFLIQGSRILLPSGGDWEVLDNKNYEIYPGVSDDKVAYIDVFSASSIDKDNDDSMQLTLQSKELELTFDLSYRVNEIGEGELKVISNDE